MDLIQKAVDSMGHDVTVTLKDPHTGKVTHVDGNLTGLGSGPRDTITVTWEDRPVLLDLNYIVSIDEYVS